MLYRVSSLAEDASFLRKLAAAAAMDAGTAVVGEEVREKAREALLYLEKRKAFWQQTAQH